MWSLFTFDVGFSNAAPSGFTCSRISIRLQAFRCSATLRARTFAICPARQLDQLSARKIVRTTALPVASQCNDAGEERECESRA